MSSNNNLIEANKVSVWYGEYQAVKSVDLQLARQEICSLIGPSGCGKSSLLRCFNRMNDFVAGFKLSGEIRFRGASIYDDQVNPVLLRRHVGMVFQKPNPFPCSISKNIYWGPKINGFKGNYDELVEKALHQVALWDEVKDRLNKSGLSLSGGQQQRLCIARAIAMEPDVILLDEPCSALDPVSSEKIEELLRELKNKYAILIVTHNMQQARRLSDKTAFMYQGELVEFGETDQIFDRPSNQLTKDYVSGRFG